MIATQALHIMSLNVLKNEYEEVVMNVFAAISSARYITCIQSSSVSIIIRIRSTLTGLELQMQSMILIQYLSTLHPGEVLLPFVVIPMDRIALLSRACRISSGSFLFKVGSPPVKRTLVMPRTENIDSARFCSSKVISFSALVKSTP